MPEFYNSASNKRCSSLVLVNEPYQKTQILYQTLPPTPPAQETCFDHFNVSCKLDPTLITQEDEPIVAVIGVGYVGQQLVQEFSKHYEVIGFDVSKEKLDSLSCQIDHSRVILTMNTSELSSATHFLVSVPTLLEERTGRVDTTHLRQVLRTISTHARVGSTIIIESSVAVGMTRDLLGKIIQDRGLLGGMSPERVDPGRISPPVHLIPKIISGLDDLAPGSLASIQRLYAPIFTTLHPVSSPEVAEMTKLYENCQRMINIAYANEMSDACLSLRVPIDPFEVSSAAATKPFGYMDFRPSAGVGGHCIPVNPHYLFSTSNFPLLRKATERMEDRPRRVADRAMARLLVGRNGNISGARVLVVGMAFKAGQNVLSNSPGVKVVDHLREQWEADVTWVDPLVRNLYQAAPATMRLDESEWSIERLNTFDLVIVVMKQTGLDFEMLSSLENTAVEWCSQQ